MDAFICNFDAWDIWKDGWFCTSGNLGSYKSFIQLSFAPGISDWAGDCRIDVHCTASAGDRRDSDACWKNFFLKELQEKNFRNNVDFLGCKFYN